MKKNMALILALLISILPLLYVSTIYSRLPLTVATHFSLDGKPDGYSSKATLVMIIALLSAFTFGMYLLLTNIHRIDPKKSAKTSAQTLQKVAFAVLILTTGISIMLIYSGAHNSFSFEKVMLPMLGLFFAYIGNLMHSVKPNYFVGIRTPWALEDEDTWRKTHQLAGKLWFAGGILITIIALLLPAEFALSTMICIMVLITIVPVVYSYRYFKLHKQP